VRVHVHNLRKMIDQYYQTEGQSNEIKLFIPKGHYRVEFRKKVKEDTHTVSESGNTLTIILTILFLCSIIFIVIDKLKIFGEHQYTEVINRDNKIWKNFFNNAYPTSIIIGDFLVFHEYNEQLNRSRRIQDYEINTDEELDIYIKNNQDKDIENWSLGELPHNSIFNIVDIQNVLFTYKKQFELNFTSEIDINFIKNRNFIYTGEFKNLRVLTDLKSNLPVNYETLPWWHGTISFQQNDSMVTLRTSHDWNVSRYVVDLTLVAKLPGQNNENYLIVAGFGYNSQIKAVKILSQRSSLISLEDQIKIIYGDVPEYFLIVFEVSGFDRASTNAEIKFFQDINKVKYLKSYLPNTK